MPLLPVDEPERSARLDQLVEQTLRYRKLVRRSNMDQPPSGIYLEILESLKAAVRKKIEDYDNTVNVWTTNIIQEVLTSCYPKVLTHARITQLAIALQQQTMKTGSWGYAQRELVVAIYASQKLISAQVLQVKERFYDDIVQEIIMEWGIQRIHNFDPNRAAFMTWINRQLQWKKSEIMGRLSSIHEISADFMLEGSDDGFSQASSPPLGDFLRTCTDTCEHGECQAVFEKHMRNRPEVTFRAMFNARYLLGKTWREVSLQFDVKNLASLEHFLKRNVPKILPCLQDCIEDKVSLWKSQH
ncbi:MAG: hypothetical protein AAF572_23035 [Cyanobacteria bacterium P01_B01_bin.77]